MFNVVDKRGNEIIVYGVQQTKSGLIQGVIYENNHWKLVFLDNYMPAEEYERRSHIRIGRNQDIENFGLDPAKFYERGYIE